MERHGNEPQEYVLSDEDYPIRVVAQPKYVMPESEPTDPISLGHFEFEYPNISATIYLEVNGAYFTSFASIEFADTDEAGARKLFHTLGSSLCDVNKAARVDALTFALPATGGTINYMRLLLADKPGDFHSIAISPSIPDLETAKPYEPYFFHEGDNYSSQSVVMDIGKSTSEVVNHVYFLIGAEPADPSMVIALPREIGDDDFQETLPEHEGFPSFEDFGGLDAEIDKLRLVIRDMETPPELFAEYGLERTGGVILVGPGGVGKTELAKALAKEMQAEFQYIQVSDIMSAWVGESGRNVRRAFEDAKASNGTVVLFFDEFDGLFSKNAGGNGGAARSLIAQFKTLLSDIQSYPNVLVVAAANSLDDFDPALLRSGRFDTHIQIPKPHEQARSAIFGKYLCSQAVHYQLPGFEAAPDSIDVQRLAAMSEDFSGADIKSILQGLLRAKMYLERDRGTKPPKITHSQIESAILGFRHSRVTEA